MGIRNLKLPPAQLWLATLVLCIVFQPADPASSAPQAQAEGQRLSLGDQKKVLDIFDKVDEAANATRLDRQAIQSKDERQAAYAESARVSTEAQKQLLDMGPKIIPLLIEIMAENEIQRGGVLSNVMPQFGTQALDPLIGYINNGRPYNGQIAYVLVRLGGDAVPPLVDLLKSPSESVRANGAKVLAQFIQNGFWAQDRAVFDLTAVDQICQTATSDKNAAVRESLVELLGKIGPRETTVFDTLKKSLLEDPEPNVRASAAKALLTFMREQNPTQRAPALQAITQCLQHDDYEGVRIEAARALAGSTADAQIAVPALRGALNDRYATVASAALTSLLSYGAEAAPAAQEVAIMLKSDPGGNLAPLECNLLEAIGPSASAVLPDLEGVMDSKNARYQANVIPAIAGIKGDAYVPTLVHLLKDSNPEIRGAATRALGSLGSKTLSAARLIKELQTSMDPDERNAASEAVRMYRIR